MRKYFGIFILIMIICIILFNFFGTVLFKSTTLTLTVIFTFSWMIILLLTYLIVLVHYLIDLVKNKQTENEPEKNIIKDKSLEEASGKDTEQK